MSEIKISSEHKIVIGDINLIPANDSYLSQRMLDVTDSNSIDKFIYDFQPGDIFVNCVGVIHPKKVANFDEINNLGVILMLDKVLALDPSKVIHISSNSPIGVNSSPVLFNECSPYSPYMEYGKSKMASELFLIKRMKLCKNIIILRPPWFYGPEMPERQMVFYNLAAAGLFPVIGNGMNLRSKVHTLNLVYAIFLSIQKPVSSSIYWISDDRPYSQLEIHQIIKRVYKKMGKKAFSFSYKLPNIVSESSMYADKFMQSINLYSPVIHVIGELNKNIACDISKAKEELGYQPIFDFEDGLLQSLKHTPYY